MDKLDWQIVGVSVLIGVLITGAAAFFWVCLGWAFGIIFLIGMLVLLILMLYLPSREDIRHDLSWSGNKHANHV